jgi:hypothetical protein
MQATASNALGIVAMDTIQLSCKMTLGKLQRVNADTDGGTVRCKCSPSAMFPLMPS